MPSRDWGAYWLARAELNATMSTCMTRMVGAVAVRDRRSFADAFNGNLPGATHCNEFGCPRCAESLTGITKSGVDLHRCLCVHAEQNIVGYCAREGIKLDGATIYTTTQPCLDCAKLLVVSGVTEIVYRDSYPAEDSTVFNHFVLRRFDVFYYRDRTV